MSEKDALIQIGQAAAIRERALTKEQLKRREEVAAHQAIIQAGVKPPAGGVFGGKGKA